MSWEHFIWFAIAALICWSLGAFAAWKGKKPVWTYGFTLLGLVIFFSFIFGMWISLERPPMRTMGETRLWYSFFLPLAGLITYVRWKYKWILSFSCILSLVFICINIFKPEIHNKTLMPALQSPWFAPHVIVYMFAYAMLGAAVVMAVYLLWFKKKDIERKEMDLCDNLTYVGLAFMTLGMLTGAIWAKEAWGHYWAWDPKETWAAATWFSYLVYIHFRLGRPLKSRPALVILLVSFVLLQMCWYGMKTFYWSFVLMLLPSMAYTQTTEKENEFSMSMQIRPRAEYRNGALVPRNEGQKAASFINNRARLSLDYKRSDLEIKMSAQHVGVWGQDPQIDKNGRFILNEAWAKLDFGKGFFAQLGRQTLIYDDERILGGLDWNVAGRYHDALKLGYANKNNEIHAILAFNQNDEKTAGGTYYNSSIGQPYKNMQTVWYHYKADKIPFGASLLFMNLGLETGNQLTQDSHTRYLQTMGTYLTYKNSGWNLDGAFYYQTGKNKDAESVSAFMASATAAYAFNKTWGMVVSFDYLSGNEEGSSKFKAFDPLYGTHHKFYGSMDYFYASAFNKGFAPGLIDGRLGARFRASAKVDMELNYHYFATATEVDFKEDLKKSLGSEVDYQINWSVMKDVKLSAGYSFMLGTKTMDAVKGGNHKSWQDWGWVSVNINPKVFFTKW